MTVNDGFSDTGFFAFHGVLILPLTLQLPSPPTCSPARAVAPSSCSPATGTSSIFLLEQVLPQPHRSYIFYYCVALLHHVFPSFFSVLFVVPVSRNPNGLAPTPHQIHFSKMLLCNLRARYHQPEQSSYSLFTSACQQDTIC